jgi:hypothetical protein
MTGDETKTRPHTGRKLALVVLVLVPLVVGLALAGIYLLQGAPFESPAELTTDNVQSLRVHLLNRKELDGGDDVGPYLAAPEDYERLLALLKAVPEVEQFPDARGPWLGEFRIVLKNGRKGTIRLYWVKPPTAPARLRFQIGEHKFEGGTAESVIRAAEESAARGQR